jgi:hypothetical protein
MPAPFRFAECRGEKTLRPGSARLRSELGSVLFGETLAKNLDAELVGVDEIFYLSFSILFQLFDKLKFGRT